MPYSGCPRTMILILVVRNPDVCLSVRLSVCMCVQPGGRRNARFVPTRKLVVKQGQDDQPNGFIIAAGSKDVQRQGNIRQHRHTGGNTCRMQ